jgi:hypothetical protein
MGRPPPNPINIRAVTHKRFPVAFALAFLVVISEGDLLFVLSLALVQLPQRTCQVPKPQNPRQSSTFTWRISFNPPAIMNKADGQTPEIAGVFDINP